MSTSLLRELRANVFTAMVNYSYQRGCQWIPFFRVIPRAYAHRLDGPWLDNRPEVCVAYSEDIRLKRS